MTFTQELDQEFRGFLYLRQEKFIGAMVLAVLAAALLQLVPTEIPKTDSFASAVFKFVFETKGGLFLFIIAFVLFCLRGMFMRLCEYETIYRTLFYFSVTTLSLILVSASHSGWLYVWLG